MKVENVVHFNIIVLSLTFLLHHFSAKVADELCCHLMKCVKSRCDCLLEHRVLISEIHLIYCPLQGFYTSVSGKVNISSFIYIFHPMESSRNLLVTFIRPHWPSSGTLQWSQEQDRLPKGYIMGKECPRLCWVFGVNLDVIPPRSVTKNPFTSFYCSDSQYKLFHSF